MANTRPDLEVINSHDIHDNALYPHVNPAANARLLMSCKLFANKYESDMRHTALLQAVIDDDRERVQRILNKYPELLLQKPNEKLIISSRYTWQKFYAENAFAMAVKRKQIEMIKIILPYYDKLPQTDAVKTAKAKEKAMSAWTNYDICKNAQGNEEIIAPPEYENYMQSLVDVFTQELFPNGHAMNSKLSDSTEDALRIFRNIMLPNRAVKLDDYLDPELMLYAAYKAYEKNFDKLQTWERRDHFCVKVIGFIQSLLSPEMAKIFCEGLYYVVEENRPISDRAKSLKLYHGESFYHSSRVSTSGLGFEYSCGGGIFGLGPAFGKTMSSKSSKFSELYAASVNTAISTLNP